eukprot:CAMPEP_0117773114 /NCGR_PEP_ID=MMETSP0947-20121206/25615_1 /TAXON_ID=44440 /ORGANISM="Chattonella subsalsa, Strain CCMP2191" /LENGTH=74 /DNA_ID=CAMNT_0005599099 /DNA_START=268 /DNA_END=488 /DNA_ORIENTATION=-
MTVRPSSATCRTARITSSAAVESSPVVGSSKNKYDGELMISTPMVKRRIWPPEMPRSFWSPTNEYCISVSPRVS